MSDTPTHLLRRAAPCTKITRKAKVKEEKVPEQAPKPESPPEPKVCTPKRLIGCHVDQMTHNFITESRTILGFRSNAAFLEWLMVNFLAKGLSTIRDERVRLFEERYAKYMARHQRYMASLSKGDPLPPSVEAIEEVKAQADASTRIDMRERLDELLSLGIQRTLSEAQADMERDGYAGEP